MDKVIKKCSKLPIIDIVILLLGAMLLNGFYKQLALGGFQAHIFAETMQQLAAQDNAPLFWKAMLTWASNQAPLLAPLSAVLLLGSGICAVLFIFRCITTFVAAGIYLVFWVSLWAYPHIWIFELLFPFIFALCAAFASLPAYIDGPSRVLGPQFFRSLKWRWRGLIILLSSAGIWYSIYLSHDVPVHNTAVAWKTAISFGILFTLSALLDHSRQLEPPKIVHAVSKRLQAIPWIDIMTLTVAAMMTLQVFADIAVGFYTFGGYATLVQQYGVTTGAPEWYRAFLFWTADHAKVLLPLQAVFEIVVAIFLSLLILRGPVLFLLMGMFATFTFAEFGTSPTLSAPTSTQTWELLFVTCVALFISLKYLADLYQATSWKERILGPSLFGNLSLPNRLIIAVAAGVLLFFAGVKTHVFGPDYLTTSWLGGGVFGLLLIGNAFLDPVRK